MTRLPTPSVPLDPPPPYDSLFATAVPPDSAVAPSHFPDYWSNPYLWDMDAGLDWDLVVPVHLILPYLISFTLLSNPCSNPIKEKKEEKKGYIEL